jgi:hypothetical protein
MHDPLFSNCFLPSIFKPSAVFFLNVVYVDMKKN